MLCSTSGVFSKVVMLLESNMENIDKDWAGVFVCAALEYSSFGSVTQVFLL